VEARESIYVGGSWVPPSGEGAIEVIDAATALPNVALHLGIELAGFGPEDTGVAVALKRGLTAMRDSGDALIGADGPWHNPKPAKTG